MSRGTTTSGEARHGGRRRPGAPAHVLRRAGLVGTLLGALLAGAPHPAAAAPRPARLGPRLSAALPAPRPAPRPTVDGVPVPVDAARGFPRDLLFSRLADGRLAGHFAVDGHVHTAASPDATLRLATIAAAGARAGLDAVVITDHCSVGAAAQLRTRERAGTAAAPLLILGEEAGTHDAHVGLWDLPAPRDGWMASATPLQCLAGRVDALAPGALSVLNHPTWRAVGAARFAPATFDPRLPGPKLDAIEVWNAEARFRSRTREVVRAWEAMLDRGLRPAIVSGSDAHRRAADVGAVRTVVVSPALTPAALAESARLGRTYVSDDARLVFTVAGQGLGEVIDGSAGAPHDPTGGAWRVAVRGLAPRGGQLTILAGRRTVATQRLEPGVPFALERDVDPRAFGARAGWFRVEIVRPTVRDGAAAEDVALLTAPIYYDLDGPTIHWAARPRDAATAVAAGASRPGRAARVALLRCGQTAAGR